MDALSQDEARKLLIDSFNLLCEIGIDTETPVKYKQKIMMLQSQYINAINQNKSAAENTVANC